MKNKRMFFSTAAAVFAVFLLSGCGGGSNSHMAMTDIGSISGESINAQDVSALCPDGWSNVAVTDITAEEPDTAAPNELKFVKGAATQESLQSNPYICIVYHSAGQEISQNDPNEWYDNVVQLQSFTTGEYTWNGYTGTTLGVPFTYVYSSSDRYTVEIWLYTRDGSENTASIMDTDVLAILQSINF